MCLWFLILWPSCCFCSSFYILALLGWPQRLISDPSRKYLGMFLMASKSTAVTTTSLLLKSLLSRFAKGVFESVSAARRKQQKASVWKHSFQTSPNHIWKRDTKENFTCLIKVLLLTNVDSIFVYQLRLIVWFNQITFLQHN